MIHSGDKLYKCEVCNIMFRLDSNLKNRNRIHTGDKRLKCIDFDKMIGHIR